MFKKPANNFESNFNSSKPAKKNGFKEPVTPQEKFTLDYYRNMADNGKIRPSHTRTNSHILANSKNNESEM